MTLPPGSTTPNAIQIFQWITNPLGYLERQNKDYGDIFTVKLTTAFNNAVFFSRPETMQQVLTNDTKQFSAPGTANRLLKPMLGDRGVILLEGLEHRQRRQLLMPQFHGDKMKAYTGLIQAITDRVIRQWQSGQIINARAQMQQISLGVILQAVFGLDRGDRYDSIRDRLINLLSVVDSPNKSSFIFIPSFQKDLGAWSPWGYFLRQREQLDKLLYQEIADRRKNHDPDRQGKRTRFLTKESCVFRSMFK